MSDSVFSSASKVLERILGPNSELERQLAARQQWFKDVFEERKVAFEKSVLKRHRRLRTGVLRYLRESRLSFILTAPVIYAGIIPLAIIDLFFTLYQYICFSVYDIPKVQRSKYLVIDRHHLAYLNPIEKMNCVYCGYGNGVIAYAREIAARTEEYWCPIKHAGRVHSPHHKYYEFLEYGDAEGYRAKEDEKNRQRLKRAKKARRKNDVLKQSTNGE